MNAWAVMHRWASRSGSVLPFILGVALLVLDSPARGDNLDEALLQQAPIIMRDLHDRGYRNVGVLKFQVQKGKAPASFLVGRLNTLMATRLENALVLAEDPARPIGITRGASALAAARDPKATWLTAAGRADLFRHGFPLAWGNQSVAVDAFVAGRVEISPDLRKTTVVIQGFDRRSLDLREITRSTVATDRIVLADLGQSFFLSQRSVRGRAPQDPLLDQEAAQSATQGGNRPVSPTTTTESFDQLLQFRILYDGQEITPSETSPGSFQVQTPTATQKVTFALRSTERIGVLLRVNGVNTWREEQDEREVTQYEMWVLEPSTDYAIQGFYPDEKTVKPFRVLEEDRSATEPLANESKRGLIEVHVFREGPDSSTPPDTTQRKLTLRSVTRRAATLPELKGEIRTAAVVRARPRGLILGAPTTGTTNVQLVTFNNPTLAASRTIVYWEKSGPGLRI